MTSTSSKKECNAKNELYVVTPIASAIRKLLLSFGEYSFCFPQKAIAFNPYFKFDCSTT